MGQVKTAQSSERGQLHRLKTAIFRILQLEMQLEEAEIMEL